MSERACKGCGADIAHKRPQAKCCKPACRTEASRRRAGKAARGCDSEAVCRVCGGSLAGRQRGTLYCEDKCKRAAARLRAAERLAGAEPAASAASTRETERERPSVLTPPTASWPACRYPKHRASDWLSIQGIVVCGTCHPPAHDSLVAAYLATPEAA
jgi:hypothetical protein